MLVHAGALLLGFAVFGLLVLVLVRARARRRVELEQLERRDVLEVAVGNALATAERRAKRAENMRRSAFLARRSR